MGAELDATAQQRRWLRAYVEGRRSSAGLTVSAVEAVDGWRDRVDYLAAVAVAGEPVAPTGGAPVGTRAAAPWFAA